MGEKIEKNVEAEAAVELPKAEEVKEVQEAQGAHDLAKEAPSNIPKNRGNTLAIVLSVMALGFGCGGLALGWMGYEKSTTPLTFLSSGSDGNAANFVEGSIADIAEKVWCRL